MKNKRVFVNTHSAIVHWLPQPNDCSTPYASLVDFLNGSFVDF